jgi:hypothetical protein
LNPGLSRIPLTRGTPWARQGRHRILGQASHGRGRQAGELPAISRGAARHLEGVAQIDAVDDDRRRPGDHARQDAHADGRDAALTNAKQFDALDRVEQAITWYERAFRLLPDEDPNKKIAKERLDVLRARK